MKIFSKIVLEISEKFLEFNDDLKKGNILSIKQEINKILLKNESSIKTLNLNLKNSTIYGINIQITGLISNYLFPAVLYNNNFRLQILKLFKGIR